MRKHDLQPSALECSRKREGINIDDTKNYFQMNHFVERCKYFQVGFLPSPPVEMCAYFYGPLAATIRLTDPAGVPGRRHSVPLYLQANNPEGRTARCQWQSNCVWKGSCLQRDAAIGIHASSASICGRRGVDHFIGRSLYHRRGRETTRDRQAKPARAGFLS